MGLARRVLRSKRAVAALFMLGALSCLAASATRFSEINPALRSPSTWTFDDYHQLFHDRRLHWCGEQGHASSKGSWIFCKGSEKRAIASLLQEPRSPERDAEVVDALDDPSPAVAKAVARFMGELAAANERLPVMRLVERVRSSVLTVACTNKLDPEVWDEFRAELWALERLRAREALPDLQRLSLLCEVAHTIAVIESSVSCDGTACPPSGPACLLWTSVK